MNKKLSLVLLGLVLVALLVLTSVAQATQNSIDIYQEAYNRYRIECTTPESLVGISVLLLFPQAFIVNFEPGGDLKDPSWVKRAWENTFTIVAISLEEEYAPGVIILGTVLMDTLTDVETFTNTWRKELLFGIVQNHEMTPLVECNTFCTWDYRIIKPQFHVHTQGSGVEDTNVVLEPKNYFLGVYPNPFNPVINIEFSVPMKQKVDVYVYNILGQRVITLYSGNLEGRKTIQWSPKEASGIFFVVMKCSKYRKVEKITLLK